MSYRFSFADNAQYGAEDLNEMVSRMVTSGVEDTFTDDVAYNASKVNDSMQLLYADGVVPASVSTLKVTKTDEGEISIAPGLAFFANGSTIEITEAETMEYEPGVKHYVYLKQDLAGQNRNYPVCSTTAGTGDVVPLAEIGADGTLTDRRKYAKGKIPGYQSNANASMVSEQRIRIDEDERGQSGSTTFSVEMGENNYSKVFCLCDDGGTSYGQLGVYSLEDESYYGLNVYGNYNAINDSELLVGYGGHTPFAHITFSVTGTTLVGTFRWDSNGYGRTERSYHFYLIFC